MVSLGLKDWAGAGRDCIGCSWREALGRGGVFARPGAMCWTQNQDAHTGDRAATDAPGNRGLGLERRAETGGQWRPSAGFSAVSRGLCFRK